MTAREPIRTSALPACGQRELRGTFIRRRDFITPLGGALAAVLAVASGLCSSAADAQARLHRVGVLLPAGNNTPGVHKLAEALKELGYVQSRNITYDIRAAGGDVERLPALARDLVAKKPEVIVSATENAARALVAATGDIPIVLALIGDPVALGLTKSMARPTANVTGFTTGHDTVAAKRLELLLEMVPAAREVALLWVPANAEHHLVEERMRRAAAALKIKLLSLPVTTADDIARAIVKAESAHVGALLVAADPLTVRNRRSIIDQCLLRNLPAMHSYSFEVRDGALMSYGSGVGEDYGRAATYVDRILKGAKVADLPFQEPVKYELSINIKTAKSLGLTVAPALLTRADEVIE